MMICPRALSEKLYLFFELFPQLVFWHTSFIMDVTYQLSMVFESFQLSHSFTSVTYQSCYLFLEGNAIVLARETDTDLRPAIFVGHTLELRMTDPVRNVMSILIPANRQDAPICKLVGMISHDLDGHTFGEVVVFGTVNGEGISFHLPSYLYIYSLST
jgi:hypothetical protein